MIREPSLFILTALTVSPLHGYAIVRRVEQLSEGRIRLRAGTLYAALDRLVREGALVPDGDETVDGRRRRLYRLTAAGRAELQGAATRLAANAALAHDALARTGGR